MTGDTNPDPFERAELTEQDLAIAALVGRYIERREHHETPCVHDLLARAAEFGDVAVDALPGGPLSPKEGHVATIAPEVGRQVALDRIRVPENVRATRRETRRERWGYLADCSSDLWSATGPRCVSLSGLTMPLMFVI